MNRQSEFNKISKSTVKIGNYSGYKVEGEPLSGGVLEEVYYLSSGSYFLRIAYGNVPIHKLQELIFSQILSTFRFLD